MDRYSVIISGLGGQGVLFAGTYLAELAVRKGQQVSFLPSYGPEARGGTCYCFVVSSRQEVASPLIEQADGVIALNEQSVQRFAPVLKPGGLLVFNSSMVKDFRPDKNIKAVAVPANDLAERIGGPKLLNMICIGAFLKATGFASYQQAVTLLPELLAEGKTALLKANFDALTLGYNYAVARVVG